MKNDKLKLGDHKLFVIRFDYGLPHFQLDVEKNIEKVQERYNGPEITVEQVTPVSKIEVLILKYDEKHDEEDYGSIGEGYCEQISNDLQKLIDKAKL